MPSDRLSIFNSMRGFAPDLSSSVVMVDTEDNRTIRCIDRGGGELYAMESVGSIHAGDRLVINRRTGHAMMPQDIPRFGPPSPEQMDAIRREYHEHLRGRQNTYVILDEATDLNFEDLQLRMKPDPPKKPRKKKEPNYTRDDMVIFDAPT